MSSHPPPARSSTLTSSATPVTSERIFPVDLSGIWAAAWARCSDDLQKCWCGQAPWPSPMASAHGSPMRRKAWRSATRRCLARKLPRSRWKSSGLHSSQDGSGIVAGRSPYADRELWSSEEEQEMWAFDLQGFVGRPTQRRLESLWPILIPRKTLSASRAVALSATHCYIIKRRW